METTASLGYGLFLLSLIANFILFIRKSDYKKTLIKVTRENEVLRKNPPKQESYDCKDLLQDMLQGEALVRITRISPSDIFLRSPRS